MLNTASSAVSNVVPFGGAVGVGATYGMCRSWGFGVPKTTLAILVSGIWNIFLKLGLPIIALVLLVAEGRATGGLVGAAIFGLAVLVVAVAGPHPGAAQRPAGHRRSGAWPAAGRVVRPAGGPAPRPPRRARRRARLPPPQPARSSRGAGPASRCGCCRTRCCSSLLQLLCLRLLGETSLATIQVFAAFAFGRLLSTVPITPSGVGFADATVDRRPGGLRRRSGRLHGRRAAVHRLHLPAGDPGRRHLVGGVEPDEQLAQTGHAHARRLPRGRLGKAARISAATRRRSPCHPPAPSPGRGSRHRRTRRRSRWPARSSTPASRGSDPWPRPGWRS